MYDRPISANGLLWSDLLTWWSEPASGGDAVALGKRLQESLASDAERKVFGTYFKAYRTALGDALPALLPQVYLHYDPAVVKTLRHRLPLPRQRMDFLLLLPGRQRVVIEVDGKHHFSEGERPSLKVYSEMVSADRELRLAGYEVYRFGTNELVGDGAKKADSRLLRQAVSTTPGDDALSAERWSHSVDLPRVIKTVTLVFGLHRCVAASLRMQRADWLLQIDAEITKEPLVVPFVRREAGAVDQIVQGV
ncbi:hypothetical protein [Bradyrhizobium sp. CB3481]|uniref:hypothetical protein n=1 Tax=Bradyrhizobium sp. CB3481 TaxID=3039158 RepID=UPI0024B181EA|nr:hypothetical protein [Bradyrhizobium sp. CB3481]WFU14498.1 hypothetical protein QA643_25410 [Bradyrhizobium sp. CB3481]